MDGGALQVKSMWVAKSLTQLNDFTFTAIIILKHILYANQHTVYTLNLNTMSKESACRKPRFEAWIRKIQGDGNGYLLNYSCLENSMDRGAMGWQRVGHD